MAKQLILFDKTRTVSWIAQNGQGNVIYFPTDADSIYLGKNKIAEGNTVTSVAGKTGAVTLGTTDISGLGAAASKGVVTTIPSSGASDSNVPTTKAVKDALEAIAVAQAEGLIFAGSIDPTAEGSSYSNGGKLVSVNSAVLNSSLIGRSFNSLTIADGMRPGLIFKIIKDGNKLAPEYDFETPPSQAGTYINRDSWTSHYTAGDTVCVTSVEDNGADEPEDKVYYCVCSVWQSNVDKAGVGVLGLVKISNNSALDIDSYGNIDLSSVTKDTLNTVGGKTDKVSGATNNNFAALDANGNLKDSGKKAADFKTVQTAKNSPSASGTSTSFIDTISQNANGEITATKKAIPEATTSAAGMMPASDKTKLDGITTDMLNALYWQNES